jgi:hypothetical protein
MVSGKSLKDSRLAKQNLNTSLHDFKVMTDQFEADRQKMQSAINLINQRKVFR